MSSKIQKPLAILYDFFEKRLYFLSGNSYVLGRKTDDSNPDISITGNAPKVSRKHAIIRYDPKTREYFLEDYSKNGITVKRKKVANMESKESSRLEIKLEFGDKIFLSDYGPLIFDSPDSAENYKNSEKTSRFMPFEL
ncbi:hypothetical protein DRN73_03940 [Candidatus Pacearchaeota archaeon]|nr:MAG: hypothetical protein DRN73_03940 [Candidatus Pacearchaeota archaeon]